MRRLLHTPIRRPWTTNSTAPLARKTLGLWLALAAMPFALAVSHTAVEARTLQEKLTQANTYFEEAENLRQALTEIPAGDRNLKQYQRVIAAYRRVYQTAPSSSKNPKSLLQIGDLYRNMGRDLNDKKYYTSAVETYDFLLKEYPHSQYRAEAMLRSAQTLQVDLKHLEEAKKRYQTLLDTHPKAPQARDARAALAARDSEPSEKANPEKTSLEKAASDMALRERPGVERVEAVEVSAPETAAAAPVSKGGPKLARRDASVPGERVAVTDVREWLSAGTTRVVIDLQGEVKYEVGRLANPPRIFVDLQGANISRTVARAIYKKYSSDRSGMVKGLRAAQNTLEVARIVAEVDADADYSVFDLTNPYRLVIELHTPRSVSKNETKAESPAGTRNEPGTAVAAPENIGAGAIAAAKSKTGAHGPNTVKIASEKPLEAFPVAREAEMEAPAPKPSTGAAANPGERAGGNNAGNRRVQTDPKQTAGLVGEGVPYGPPKPEGLAISQAPPDQIPAEKTADQTIARPLSGSQTSELNPKIAKSNGAGTVKPASEKSGTVRVAEKTPATRQKPDDVPSDGEKANPNLSADLALPVTLRGDGAAAETTKLDEAAADVKDPVSSQNNGKGSNTAKAGRAKGKSSPSDLIADNSRTAQPNRDGSRSLTRALGLKIGRIILDPGHGGHDTGTIGPTGLDEKDLVLDVALRLGKIITERLGSEVIYTRQDDTFIPLETRTAIANEKQADLFLSIHANSSPSPRARGIETYYLSFATDPEALEVAARENADSQESIHQLQDLVKKIALHDKVDESKDFAADLQSALHERLSKDNRLRANRGVKKAPFMVLVGARMPSVLAEIAFLSNPQEERALKTKQQRQKIAQALYEGIERYVDTLSGVKVASDENVTQAAVK